MSLQILKRLLGHFLTYLGLFVVFCIFVGWLALVGLLVFMEFWL